MVQHANDAVGETRRREHAELSRDGDQRLRGSRFRLLTGREALGAEERQELDELQRRRLRTGRVWAIKELLRDLWLCHSREEAEERMQRWLAWVQRCRVSAMVRVARMVRRRREGILNAIELRASDGLAEGINSKIRMLKYLSCGFRRRERFQTVVHFHLGKMDLYPDGLAPLPP